MDLERIRHREVILNKLGRLGALFQLCYLATRNRQFRELSFLKLKLGRLLAVIDGLGIAHDTWVTFVDKDGKIVKSTLTSERQPEGFQRFHGMIEISFVVRSIDGREVVESGSVSVSILSGQADEADDIPPTATQNLKVSEASLLTSQDETKDILRQFGIVA